MWIMRNVRITKKTKGIYSFYRAEIQRTRFFGLIKYWTPFWVSRSDGDIHYYSQWYPDKGRPEEYILYYSQLTGEKIIFDEPIPQ